MSLSISSNNVFFRLQGANLSGASYRDAFSQRNALNLVSKATQLVADLENIRSVDRSSDVNFTVHVERMIESLEITISNPDNGLTLPDLLRGQGIDLQS